jgi:hypothetical protein
VPDLKHGGVNALLFYAGLEVGYNMGGATLSSPQTTELRVAGKEGGGASEGTLMKWVHISTGKVIVITVAVGLVTGNWWSFLGGLVSTLDLQSNYWYAKRCGRKLRDAPQGGVPGPKLSDVSETVYRRP